MIINLYPALLPVNNFPKISIITPNYNGGAYLEETILSIINQQYPNIEYIIIDGGSSDNSVEIIKKYESHLAYWVSEKDKGLYHAVQKGFERSTGEIMAWLNSDDMYHKKSLFTVADIFTNFDQVNWLVGASTFYDEQSRIVYSTPSRLFTKYDFLNFDFKSIQQESVFWRRVLWDKAGASLKLNLKYAGDFELWLRFFKYDRLFVTHALIGGFRWRSSNQLSLDHLEDYVKEANTEIENYQCSREEIRIMRNYSILLQVDGFIKKMKVFNTDWILQRFRNKHFMKPSRINFNRNSSKFVLSN